MSGRSLRLRLALAGALAIALALTLAGFGLTLLFERHAYRTLSDDLDVNVRQLVGDIDVDPAGGIAISRPPQDPRFDEPLSGLYWQVDAGASQLRSRSLWDKALTAPEDRLSEGQTHYHQIAGPGGKLLLLAERRIVLSAQGQHKTARVFVASDLTRLRQARDAFVADLIPGLALLALFLAVATWLQLSLGLLPLDRLAKEIAETVDGRRRRLSEDAPGEVQPLVREVNGLLETQERELERARGRAADLAHGLKTPLAALAGDARLLRDRGSRDVAESLEAIGETMRRHVERELARARLRSASPRRGLDSTPLRSVVDSLARTLGRAEKGERTLFENEIATDITVPMERMDLTELIGNLLDNATRHARTRVRLSCESGASSGTAILIEDDGPGLDPQQEAIVRQRGGRLDGGGSAGLGLAIAQDILDAYGWRMAFSRSALGGLKVTLEDGGAP